MSSVSLLLDCGAIDEGREFDSSNNSTLGLQYCSFNAEVM